MSTTIQFLNHALRSGCSPLVLAKIQVVFFDFTSFGKNSNRLHKAGVTALSCSRSVRAFVGVGLERIACIFWGELSVAESYVFALLRKSSLFFMKSLGPGNTHLAAMVAPSFYCVFGTCLNLRITFYWLFFSVKTIG